MSRTIYNPVIKDTTTFIHTAAETGNQYTEVEVTLMPGGGTPLHYHESYEETFRVSEGVLSLETVNKQIITLYPGQVHTIPVRAHHRFFNASKNPVKFNVLIAPGSTGFEQALRILYGLAADGHTNKQAMPKKITQLAVIMVMSDMNAPGLLSLFTPLFRWYAGTGNGKRTKQYLVSRYCKNAGIRRYINSEAPFSVL